MEFRFKKLRSKLLNTTWSQGCEVIVEKKMLKMQGQSQQMSTDFKSAQFEELKLRRSSVFFIVFYCVLIKSLCFS